MPYRVAISTLDATTYDVLNVIRQNASYEYQSSIPVAEDITTLKQVGARFQGYPAFANEFINALVNRIALYRLNSAVFNNPFARLKKGFLEFGETVEDIFVGIAKVRAFNPEKTSAREYARTPADVRTSFYPVSWKVQYPITIEYERLRAAFTTEQGVRELIEYIIEQVYQAAEYDEFLLFKYLIIKAVAHGRMKPESIGDGTDLNDAATAFRGMSNLLPFRKTEYNEAGVPNTTPKNKQCIFMDARFNAAFDVEVLSRAFNMDKADYMGSLFLIDDFTTFDNERFAEIRAESDMIEEVTSDELALMADVKAILVDEDWFQVYDNLATMTDNKAGSGLYWNYWYNVWKIVATSPFANAVVFVTEDADTDLPETLTAEVVDKSVSAVGTVLTLAIDEDDATVAKITGTFVQTEDAVEEGVAVHKYGAYMFPANADPVGIQYVIGDTVYTAMKEEASAVEGDDPELVEDSLATTADVGDTFTLYPPEA